MCDIMYNKSQSSYIVEEKDYFPYALTKHWEVQQTDSVLNFKLYLRVMSIKSDFWFQEESFFYTLSCHYSLSHEFNYQVSRGKLFHTLSWSHFLDKGIFILDYRAVVLKL